MPVIQSSRAAKSRFPQPTGLDVESISPRLAAKFSPNLYAYLKGRCGARFARVYRDDAGKLWLGFIDDTGAFVGQSLNQVLSYGRKAQTFSYVDMDDLTEVADFWARYQQVGRCAIDERHATAFVGEDTRWLVRADGTERECIWCGNARQRLVRKEVVTTTESWVAS